MSSTQNITLLNVDHKAIARVDVRGTGSSRMFNWVDYDGSATLRSTPTIVGSWPSWWNLAPDCSYEVRSGCGLGGRASKLESCIQ
jgi:hypothetical protein